MERKDFFHERTGAVLGLGGAGDPIACVESYVVLSRA
jgi:hypothetical protein